MIRAHHHERGQVFPLWIGAIITTFMFAFLAINYGNTIRYEIRAQNAADSVAQGLMSLQSERYNQMLIALYGSGVEEYRLRHILDGIMLASNESGGCLDSLDPNMWVDSGTTPYDGNGFKSGTCSRVYSDLTAQYQESLNRYTADAKLLNDYSSNTSYTNWKADAKLLLTHMYATSRCNKPSYGTAFADGTDCGFKYTIVGTAQRTGLGTVQQDAQNIFVPGLGRSSSLGVDTENAELFAPAEIDVASCATVPPIIPNFGPLHLKNTYAIGRAAATIVQMESDWLQPGAVYDPAGRPASTAFQPDETYTAFTAGSDTSEAYNWYGVDFGGNAGVAYVNYGAFDEPFYNNEFSVYTGWWNAISIKPFVTPAPQPSSIC